MTPEELAAIRDRATRPRRTVPVVLDGTIRGRIEDLQARMETTSAPGRLSTRTGPDPKLQAELDALYDEADASTLRVVVEGLPGTDYRALLGAHPARKDADGKVVPEDRLGANSDTLPPVLVRACIIGQEVDGKVEPLDAEFVDWLIGFLTDAQMEELTAAAFQVCRGDVSVPLPRTRSATRTSAGA